MSTRRKPPPSTPNGSLYASAKPAVLDDMPLPQPSTFSPFLPTLLEASLLLLYPVTLVMGSLFSILAPHIASRSGDYSAQHQSYYPPSQAPSYFAQKRNVFNMYFVKVGWFWVTLALAALVATHPHFGRPLAFAAQPLGFQMRRAKAALRWAGATLVWAAVTQWFFGPALIDRSFRLTGGVCEVLQDPEKMEAMGAGREVLSHAACKMIGGQWKGGHDISGHVFLLILGSAVLWMELLPVVLHARGLREERRISMPDGRVVTAAVETAGSANARAEKDDGNDITTGLGVRLAVGVVALSWWMLLMTAAFFHTWFEKLTGLLVAFIGLWLIYFLPRGVPALRRVLGMPGL